MAAEKGSESGQEALFLARIKRLSVLDLVTGSRLFLAVVYTNLKVKVLNSFVVRNSGHFSRPHDQKMPLLYYFTLTE